MKVLAVIVGLLVLWGGGLLWFAGSVGGSTPAPEPDKADLIVVLTGNAQERIAEALRLLQTGKAPELLISGVNQEVHKPDLRKIYGGPRRLYDCCVELGYAAETTQGNAQEIAYWTDKLQAKRLILVTSDYHMPRALLEVRGQAPAATIIPYAVATTSPDLKLWMSSGKSLKLMVTEYNKYLIVLLREGVDRLSSLGRRRPPPLPASAPASAPAPAQ